MAIDYEKLKNTNTIFGGDDGIIVPVGDSAARPGSPAVGTLRYNNELGLGEFYTATGWSAVDSPPTVTNISGTINVDTDSIITVTGGNFKAASIIQIEGNGVNNVNRQLVTTFVSSSTLTADTDAGATPFIGNASFNLRVINPSGLTGLLEPAGTIDRDPVWSTSAGSLGTFGEGQAVSVTVSASDPDGTTITYGTSSGSLPGGLSLNTSTGVISGTASAVASDTTSSFTLSATSNGFTATRSFSITIANTPTISGVSPTTFSGASGQVFTITGTGIRSTGTITFRNADNSTTYTGTSYTQLSSTQATAVFPSNVLATAAPLDVTYTDPYGNSVISDNVITGSGSAPSWTTASGSLGTVKTGAAGSFTVAATDADSQAITYSLVSGSFPTGLTINSSTGVISGTNSGSVQTYSFTLRATDTVGNTTDRAFSIISAAPTTQVFTNTGSDQSFVVPAGVTSINVKMWGAGGTAGNSTSGASPGGNGAGGGSVTWASMPVTPGETLTVVVGSSIDASASNGTTIFPNSTYSYGSNTSPQVYGGGGQSGVGDGGGSNGAYGGPGGGASGIRRSGTYVIAAYGGGGGGGGGYVGGSSTAGRSATSTNGNSAGGADINSTTTEGGNGDGRGGGGGSGGSGSSQTNGQGNAGASGSNLVPSGATGFTGSGQTPANTGDANYVSPAGTGGTGTASGSLGGSPGRVVIIY